MHVCVYIMLSKLLVGYYWEACIVTAAHDVSFYYSAHGQRRSWDKMVAQIEIVTSTASRSEVRMKIKQTHDPEDINSK